MIIWKIDRVYLFCVFRSEWEELERYYEVVRNYKEELILDRNWLFFRVRNIIRLEEFFVF